LANIAFATATLVTSSVIGAEVYDLDNFRFTYFGATDIDASLETSTTGTFTTEDEIESFFNSATYSVILKDGDTIVLELNNSNSSWDLRFGGVGSSAILTSTQNELTLDFSTPNEISSVDLVLMNSPGTTLQYTQANNISDFNFVTAFFEDLMNTADAAVPYDEPFVFEAQIFADDFE